MKRNVIRLVGCILFSFLFCYIIASLKFLFRVYWFFLHFLVTTCCTTRSFSEPNFVAAFNFFAFLFCSKRNDISCRILRDTTLRLDNYHPQAFNQKTSFKNAVATCKKTGANLLSLHSPGESEFVRQHVMTKRGQAFFLTCFKHDGIGK